MDKNDFKAIDKLKASSDAVERAVESALKAYDSGKVIELKKTKKINYKPVSIIAASLVAVIACTAFFGNLGTKNSFTITASAVEATSDEATPDEKELSNKFTSIGMLKYGGNSGFGEPGEGGTMKKLYDGDIDLLAKLSCKGKNVKYVTYSTDANGAIGLFTANKLVKHSKAMKTFKGNSITEKNKSIKYYHSVTSAYDTQLENARLTFYKEFSENDQKIVLEYFNKRFYKEHEDESKGYSWAEPYWADTTDKNTVNNVKDSTTRYVNFMLRDHRINVTVTYNDGTKDTKKLVMRAKCIPYIAHYKDWDNQHLDKYGDKDIYRFDQIEVSAKIEK